MVQPLPAWDLQVGLVFHNLRRHHLAKARPQPPLEHGRLVDQLGLHLLALVGRGPRRSVA
jgi:hypothetical protein